MSDACSSSNNDVVYHVEKFDNYDVICPTLIVSHYHGEDDDNENDDEDICAHVFMHISIS